MSVCAAFVRSTDKRCTKKAKFQCQYCRLWLCGTHFNARARCRAFNRWGMNHATS